MPPRGSGAALDGLIGGIGLDADEDGHAWRPAVDDVAEPSLLCDGLAADDERRSGGEVISHLPHILNRTRTTKNCHWIVIKPEPLDQKPYLLVLPFCFV